MYRKIIACITVLLITVMPVAADSPWQSYGVSLDDQEYASPDVFTVQDTYTAEDMGCGELESPADLTMDEQGNVYLLDRDAGRIVCLDPKLHRTREITAVIGKDGEEQTLYNPSSLFVTADSIYVADSGNARGLRLDFTGRIIQEYCAPADWDSEEMAFSPLKITADSQGNVYMIVQNVYQGLVVYDREGLFQGYFGSPPVTVTLRLLADRFWKQILSDEQRDELAQYVPIEYSNITIDEQDFIYAVISNTEDRTQQLRKLNALGNNVLLNKENFGEKEAIYYQRTEWTNAFVDVAVENGFSYALDSKWSRLYWYDSEGNRLGSCGTIGEQMGSFASPVAVCVRDRVVYVLDSRHKDITLFTLTEYGSAIYEASVLYRNGNYQEAITPWQRVLSMNVNNEMAYIGVGEALLKSGNYAEAIECFRAGGNRERESVAFSYRRAELLRKFSVPVLFVVLFALISVLLLTNRHILERIKVWRIKHKKEKSVGSWRAKVRETSQLVWNVLIRPLESLQELKNKRYTNSTLVFMILIIWLVIKILNRQCYGYRFHEYSQSDFSLLVQVFSTILPFFLFCTANWAVCSIMDGEGKYGEILTVTSLSLIPYVGSMLLTTLLSNVLVLEEAMFLQILSAIGIGWSLLLLFQGQRIFHNYTGGKTVLALFLTVCGVAILLVLALLIFSLLQQVFSFVSTVYSEVVFRR